MNLFFDAFNGVKGQLNNVNNNNNNIKQQKLRTQLYYCTYSDDVKFQVQKAVKQVLHVYPFFETDILTYTQNYQQKKFIEIKGIMEIQVKGKVNKVDFNMMLPKQFPKKAPFVRIINRNTEATVSDFYTSCRSPNDPKSFVINEKINQIKTWDQSKSLVVIIIESQDLFRNHFPFLKSKLQNSFSNNNQDTSKSPWQNQNQGFNNPGFKQAYNNQGYNNQGYNSQGYNSQGYNSQGYNSQGYNNQGFNNQGFNNQGFNNQGYGSQSSKQPPIPFGGVNITQAIAGGQKFTGTAKKNLQKLKVEQIKALQKIQLLDVITMSQQSQSGYLRKQNQEMQQFLNKKQQVAQLGDLVQPANALSEQMLQILSSIKSREQCIIMLESKFSNGEIVFDEFIKLMKKMEEQKFEEKVLLNKCISLAR